MAFSVLALLAEILLVFTLAKCGKMLGPFGRLLKRFLFDVKRGEEDQFVLHYPVKQTRSWVATMNSDQSNTEGPFTYQDQEFVDIHELERRIASSR